MIADPFYVRCIALILSFAWPVDAYAQGSGVAFPPTDKDLYIWFDSLTSNGNPGIVNGRVYTPPAKGFKSHHYFSAEPASATIYYAGHPYKEQIILFDVFADVLVIQVPRANGMFTYIVPEKERVSAFIAYGRTFIFADNDFTKGRRNSGYFDVLFHKPELALLAKRSKEQYSEKGENRYRPTDQYYIITGDKWKPFTGKKDLFAFVQSRDKQKRINAFIRENKIKLRKRDYAQLRQLFSFCFSLLSEN